MTQLSFISALEAAVKPVAPANIKGASHMAMAVENRPTPAQVSYLKKLTRIRTDSQLSRFVMRRLGSESETTLTRADFAKVIEMEVAEKRWAA
jgi:hypothetical protein